MTTLHFDSPLGTPEGRASQSIWPDGWVECNWLGNYYLLTTRADGTKIYAIHTGADLVHGDQTAHSGVYACGDGVITCASRLAGTWGNVIIERCDLPNGKHIWFRYAHVENMLARVGDVVQRGQQLASVGNAFNQFVYHLHFDVSLTDVLHVNPGHWPGLDKAAVLANYVEPRTWLQENRSMIVGGINDFQTLIGQLLAVDPTAELHVAVTSAKIPPNDFTFDFSAKDHGDYFQVKSAAPTDQGATTSAGVNLRAAPGLSAKIVRVLPNGAAFTALPGASVTANGYTWIKIQLVDGTVGYLAREFTNVAT